MGHNWLDDLVPISRRMALLTHASANRAALSGICPGMEVSEVRQRMGTETRTGSSGYFTNIVLHNPHRRFVFEPLDGLKLEVLLYLTRSSLK